MTTRPGLGALLVAGTRALSRYTGTLFVVFVAQSALAAGMIVGGALVLAQAFARYPLFDRAVDGDLVALIWSARHARGSFLALGGLVFGTLMLWQLAAWFVAGGVYGVFAQRPETRGETTRCFGASGAATYLAYARLAICALPGYALVVTVLGLLLGLVGPRLELALTLPELVGPLALALIPSGLLLHYFWTVTDYARIELTLRLDTHAPGALASYGRALAFVARTPRTLVHGALGWLLFALVTGAYLLLAHGHPMYGAAGAITLFIARLGVSLLRMAIRVGIMAGQVELGRTRPLPPRRIEAKAATHAA